MFYPHAAFAVGGRVPCNQGWFGSAAPQVGSQVVVTPFGEPDGQGVTLIHAEWWELPVFFSTGQVHYPGTLAPDHSLEGEGDLAAVVHALSAAVASRCGRRGILGGR